MTYTTLKQDLKAWEDSVAQLIAALSRGVDAFRRLTETVNRLGELDRAANTAYLSSYKEERDGNS